MEKILSKSDNRFDISNDGWRRMNAGRKAAELIREAISNTFDIDDVTEVRVTLSPGLVVVEDNSEHGIDDINLITTVFMTNKTDSHLKRGRKGRGLKELISAAEYAEVDTIGSKVIFDQGRTVTTSNRLRGTKVTVKVGSWGQAEIDDAIRYLKRVIAPNCTHFYVNNTEVVKKTKRLSFSRALKTQVVEDGIQQETYETGQVDIVNLAKGEREGWIYEMGIPVQSIPAPFHVNIQQRIPLNDNRDSVSAYWLCVLYSHIIESIAPSMSLGAMKYRWFQDGLDYIYDKNTCLTILKKLFGDLDKVAYKSSNYLANDVAQQHGYRLIDKVSMSHSLARIVDSYISSAEVVAGKIEAGKTNVTVNADDVDPKGRLRLLTRLMAIHLIYHDVSVHFFKRERDFTGSMRLAHFLKDNMSLGFNVMSSLDFKDITNPTILSTICHELTHYYVQDHGVEFVERYHELSGKMAKLFIERRDEIAKCVGIQIAEKSGDVSYNRHK